MGRYGEDHGAAAYTLVDLSELEDDLRKDIIEDASAGGGRYGIKVVEESINGPARAPIFGYYNDGPDAERWAKAKEDLGIGSTEIADEAVTGIEVDDPRRAAQLRENAAQEVEKEAARIRAGEEAAVKEITGDTDAEASARRASEAAADATKKSKTPR